MTRASIPAATLAVALLACGGLAESSAPAPEGGTVQDAATQDGPMATHTAFLTVIHAGGNACMPQSLPVDAQGQVPCSIFELPAGGGGCDGAIGLSTADPGVAASVRSAAQASSSQTVCQLAQLPESAWVNGSCASSPEAGWCYVTGAAAGSCPQALRFSATASPPAGSVVLLGCS
ncbi:MAG TPA: hypothetical protein VIF15_00725 [Polyangiaceae bacterium]